MVKSKEIDETILKYLNPFNYKTLTPLIYVLPKLHKSPPAHTISAGRPIISECGSPTEKNIGICRLFSSINCEITKHIFKGF